MTDTNHIEVLRKAARTLDQYGALDEAREVDEVIRALSARASAGEGGHVGNEWADMAVNGVQWLRNIRDGISTADEALAEMESNARRITALAAAPQPAQAGASGGGVAEIVRDLCELNPADPDAPETVCVRVDDLERIVERHTTPASPATRLDGATQCNACGGWNKPGCEPCCASPATGDWAQSNLHHAQGAADYIEECAAILGGEREYALRHAAAILRASQPAAPRPQEVTVADMCAALDRIPLLERKPPAECQCALCDALNATPESRRRVHELIAEHPELFPHATPPAHGDGEGDAIAPWPDFAGNQIRDRDRIRHPDGTTGTVLRLADLADGAEGEAWRVVYGGGDMSRLSLQIGDKGQAVVVTTRPTPEAQEARDAARYRWLRLPGNATVYARDAANFNEVPHHPGGHFRYVEPANLDAAIDAALALPAQGEGKNA